MNPRALAQHTYDPQQNLRSQRSALTAFLLLLILFPVEAAAANLTLKPETLAAWQDYLNTVTNHLKERLRPGGHFLWTFDDPERASKVRAGELVVEPAPGHNPLQIPGGLIHHWMGAMFLPGVRLDDVLAVTRDYDRYKDYYGPAIVDSKTISRDASNDFFSVRVMNKSFFLKTALDAEYESVNVRLDENRSYSTSRTIRLQEVDECGEPGEHMLPQGQGDGYIWKVFGIGRLEQRDGGVYMEMEAIALTRDIPAAARFLVEPVVRRFSRNSLLLSLQQTQHAVLGNPTLLTRRHVDTPAAALTRVR